MIGSLPLFHQVRGREILLLGEGEPAEPKRRLLERAGANVVTDKQQAIARGVRLAFVAIEDAEEAAHEAAELRAAGMLVNVVDQPKLCDFTTPSILDRDPLLIAIGTGGASAGLAKHVRLRLERILPQSLGNLANALKRIRPALRTKYPDGADRRRVLDQALSEGGALDPMVEDADKRVDLWLEGQNTSAKGAIHRITFRSTDPEEMTLREARLLGMADILVLETVIPETLLARARADAEQLHSDDQIPKGDSKLVLHLAMQK